MAVRELIFGALRSKVTAWKVEIEEGGGLRGADTILCNNEGSVQIMLPIREMFFFFP